jgi:hypothetical protein
MWGDCVGLHMPVWAAFVLVPAQLLYILEAFWGLPKLDLDEVFWGVGMDFHPRSHPFPVHEDVS